MCVSLKSLLWSCNSGVSLCRIFPSGDQIWLGLALPVCGIVLEPLGGPGPWAPWFEGSRTGFCHDSNQVSSGHHIRYFRTYILLVFFVFYNIISYRGYFFANIRIFFVIFLAYFCCYHWWPCCRSYQVLYYVLGRRVRSFLSWLVFLSINRQEDILGFVTRRPPICR